MEGAAGSIVWVRRRNGSWWPGRILGAEEVSASHLMSPRSGTPVKLLGREDASVDWYNLEKSRRVKAFRCGEFDDCIERAEASPCIPMRKREKYARREDAILHALELEKQFEMKHRKGNISVGTSEKTTGAPKKGLNCFSEVYTRNGDPGLYDKFASHKYQTISRKMVVPYQGDNVSKPLCINKMESGKLLGWEENIPELVPRISGLQGFGLRIAPSKLSSSVTWEHSGNLFENHADVLSCAGHMMEDSVSPVNTDGGKSSVSAKRKRSEVDMVEDTLFGQHDTCQQFLQRLQSSVKLPNYHSCHSDSDAGTVSREDEINHLAPACRAKRTPCIYLPASSFVEIDHNVYQSEEIGTIETQLKMDDQLHQPSSLAEDHSSCGLIEATESVSSEKVIWEDEVEVEGNTLTDKFGHMNKDEMPLSSSISQSHLNVQTADVYAEIGVYSWHVKGKRKRRNVAKRTPSRTKGNTVTNVADKDNSSVKEMAYDGKGNSFTVGRMDSSSHRTLGQNIFPNKEFTHAYDGGVNNLPTSNLTGYSSRKYYSFLQEAKGHGMNDISYDDSDSGSQLISHPGWEDEGPSHASQRGYCGESDDCFDPVSTSRINDKREPMLVDVDLKVQSRFQGEHVPLVSLMSRLNGKSIIGHPVQVEILEEASSGRAFFRNYGGLADNTASAWWTARRTGTQRVVSSSPAASAFKVDYADFLQYSDRENTPISYSSQFSHQAQLAKKSMSYACGPMSGKSHKKSANRVNLQSNYKNRRRSSVTTDKKRRRTGKCTHSSGGNLLSRLINPEAALPSVTCVPVKVVFSRILEAVGRPSAAAAHRVRMTMTAVKDPS